MKPMRIAILFGLLTSMIVVLAIFFISNGSTHNLPTDRLQIAKRRKTEVHLKTQTEVHLKTRSEENVASEVESVSSPNRDSLPERSAEHVNEKALRTSPENMTTIEDFLKSKQLDDPAKNFSSGAALSGNFIEKYLQGTYEGVIKADQDYNLTLSFRNGEVIDNRFIGEIFVEIAEIQSSRKTSFWADANRRVRVVTEPGKESILIEFLARNLPAPNRMLQLLFIEDDDKSIVGNFYAMNDKSYIRTGFFQLKKRDKDPP